MSWYYANEGTQQGPVSEEQLAQLVAGGVIRPETLVWKEGMANWLPYAQVRGSVPAMAGSAPGQPLPSVAAPVAAGMVTCSECRQQVPQDAAISYGSVWVCSACKPVFLQKLREGALTGSIATLQYAGFWIRFAARFIDGLILGVLIGLPSVLIVGVKMGGFAGRPPSSGQLVLNGLIQLAGFAVTLAYGTFFVGKYGATLGKMAVGIRVVTPDGAPISYGRAFGRVWADLLSTLTCYIGYIIAAFDAEKRALHDHICHTRVVYK